MDNLVVLALSPFCFQNCALSYLVFVSLFAAFCVVIRWSSCFLSQHVVSSLPSESNQTKLWKSVPHSFFCYSTKCPLHLLLFVRRIFFWKTVLHVDSGVDGPAPEALRLHVIYIVKKIVFFKLANTFRRAMDDDGGDDVLLDYQPQPTPEVHPPGVLQPGKLGLAGMRPDKVDGHVTSPCSYGSMHGYTWGELFFLFCSFFLV